MQFGLTESQQILKNNARKFFAAECPMAEVRRLMEADTAYDAALWDKMAEQGFTGIIFPEEHGGLGLGLVELALLLEEMGRALVPGPYFSTVVLAGALLDAAAGESHKRKYLVPICGGKARATLALLEKSACWDVDAVALSAEQVGPTFRLNGEKLFVPDVGAADFMVVAGRADRELVLAVVDSRAAGVQVAAMPAIDLTRKLYAVTFDGANAEVIATGAAARGALERTLDVSAAALAAEMTGGMQRTLEMTVEYAKTRKQFGRPIGQYQAVQHQCADMFLWTESSRSAAYHAAWALQEKTPDAPVAVSVAKSYTSDAGRETGNRGVQVHGGMGFTWENDVHLYYRRAKASEIAFGDAAFHRERIARLVVDCRAMRAKG